jgi:EAL domain-containing protein (putative c-di-GMP-specific phosphodiesterase class I)
MPVVKPEHDVEHLLAKMMKSFLAHPFRLNEAIFRIAAKAGVALFPDDGADTDILFRNAEAALKKAKSSGERHLFYTQSMNEMVAGKLTMENQLRQALLMGEFVLHYQPKVNLVSGKVTSAEALIRWNKPDTGLVPPSQFIPILEETGMIVSVGEWVLQAACRQAKSWQVAGFAPVRVAVNLSARQLNETGLVETVARALADTGLEPEHLELEVTESMLMHDIELTITTLDALAKMGVAIAIDDYGTGYSSLAYLKRLHVDVLKLDQSFVKGIGHDADDEAIVASTISMAHRLGLTVIAEGVETESQLEFLRLNACDSVQGYLFSRPIPAEGILGLLQHST